MTKPRIAKHSASPQIVDSACGRKRANAAKETRMNLEAKIRAVAESGWLRSYTSPRVSTLAKFINENLPHVEAKVDKTHVDTSRQVPGHRFVYAHTGRDSNRLQVFSRKTQRLVFKHVATETYRHNYEVCQWIVKQLDGQKKRQSLGDAHGE